MILLVGMTDQRKMNTRDRAISADPIRMAAPASSAGRSGRSARTAALGLGDLLGLCRGQFKRLQGLLAAPRKQPIRVDVRDKAESTDQMMRQQRPALVLLVFVLRHVEGLGHLPLLPAECRARRLHAPRKLLFEKGFRLGFGHTDSMS